MEVDVSWLNVPFRVFGARVGSMPWEHLLGLDFYTPSFGNIRAGGSPAQIRACVARMGDMLGHIERGCPSSSH